MPVSDKIIARARRSDRQAVETVLSDSYPAVHRMAHALTGEPAIAMRVVRAVLRAGVRVMPTWRVTVSPENWFYHHTLLAARDASPQQPPPDRDLLVTAGPSTEPAYVAFVRALRGLPRQQMEAFLLNHREKLNTRLLGVAMDCSSNAAATHLTAAIDSLQTISGSQFAALTAALERAYATLTPPETVVRAAVQQQAGAAIWPMRIRRLVRRVFWLAILVLIGYAVWHWHAVLLQWIQSPQSTAQTQST